MTVTVHSVYSGRTWTYRGTEDQVRYQLLVDYPFLRSHEQSLPEMVGRLNGQQALMAELRDE